MKFKAAIFDMDGLLIDSEIYWHKFGPEIWKHVGVVFDEKFRKDIQGLRLRDAAKVARKKYNPKVTFRQIADVYIQYRKKVYYDSARLLKGARELLQALKRNGVLTAIGTSASRHSVEYMMKRNKLHNLFDAVVAGALLKIPGKPHPAIYLRAIKQLKVQPRETVIFEDTGIGVRAAVGSGANVIAVPDKRWSHGDFSDADLIAKTLADRRIYKFMGLK